MDKEEFARQRDELQREIYSAFLAYKVYLAVWPSEEFVGVINQHIGFSQPVRYALLYTFMMGFAKIFDKDTRTMSLINLLDTAIENSRELAQNTSNDEIVKLKEQLLEHSNTLGKIESLRNQYLAHLDKRPKSKPKILKCEIDNLSKTIDTIFNRLSSGHDGNIYSWSFQEDSSSRTTLNVLNILKDEMVRQKTKSKRLIRKTSS